MKYSLLGLSRRNLALIASAAAVAATLCSASMGSGASQLSRHALRKPLPFPWNVVKVNVPGESNTEVTGINSLPVPEIVGDYVSSVTSGVSNYRSFYATVPSSGTSITSFEDASYPVTYKDKTTLHGTEMNAINSLSTSGVPVLVGVVSSPGDQNGNWAVVFNQGLWSLTNNPGTFKGTVGDGYLYGINNQDIAVGYHTKNASCASCSPIAYFVAPPERYADITFPSTISTNVQNAIAYGINASGDMVGIVEVSAGWESWYALCKSSGCPTESGSTSGSGFNSDAYCWGALDNGGSMFRTTAYAINDGSLSVGGVATREVVGSYSDGSGVTHGFLVQVSRTSANVCQQVGNSFQKIDEPDAASLTVVRGVNDAGDIAGYYNSSGSVHGFVGIYNGAAERRRLRR